MELRRIDAFQRQGVCDLIFHPDGQRAISGGRQISVWGLSSGQRLAEWTAHETGRERVSLWSTLQLHPDGERLFSCIQGETKAFALATGRLLWTAAGRLGPLFAQGKRAALIDRGNLAVLDLDTGQIGRSMKVEKLISPLYHPAMEDMTQEEIDAHTPSASIGVVAKVHDGRLAVGTDTDGTDLFDPETGAVEHLRTWRLGEVLPGGRALVTLDGGHFVIVEATTGKKLFSLGDPAVGLSALHPDGRRLYGAYLTNLVGWDLTTGQRLPGFDKVDKTRITELSCEESGRYLLFTAYGRQRVVRLDLASGRRRALPLPEGSLTSNLGGPHPTPGLVLGISETALLLWEVARAKLVGHFATGLLGQPRAAAGPSGALAAWNCDQWGQDAGFVLYAP